MSGWIRIDYPDDPPPADDTPGRVESTPLWELYAGRLQPTAYGTATGEWELLHGRIVPALVVGDDLLWEGDPLVPSEET